MGSLKIKNADINSIIDQINAPYVTGVSENNGTITVTHHDGSTNSFTAATVIPDIGSGGTVGPTTNTSSNLGTSADITISIPQVQYDSKGRVIAITNHTVTIT